ncbi:hypothetical protein MCEMRE195_01015 [Candidatus Nanopelagicaceae bacterium]
MEILRFEDQGPSAPHRKKSSRGFLIVGLIATLFGISSAFASSTIQINGGNAINLSQGVQAVTGCDPQIGLLPQTQLSDSLTSFNFSSLRVGYHYNSDAAWGIANQVDTSTVPSCLGKSLKVQFYKKSNSGGAPSALTCSQMGASDALGTALVLAGEISIDGSQGNSYWKCDSSAIYFKVKEDYALINFEKGFDPGLFDAITLESVDTNY